METAKETSPVAKKIPHEIVSHGIKRTDNYFWMRNRENSEVIDYIKEENAYTESIMKPAEQLTEKIYREFVSRIKEDDESVPEKISGYYYYTRFEKGKQYPVYCRKKETLSADEEVLLNPNEMVPEGGYFKLGAFSVSPDQNILAYATDTNGSEVLTLYFKNLTTGELYTDTIPNVNYGATWAEDDKTVFYTTLDDAKRPSKVWAHELGTDPANDRMVFHEPDGSIYLGVSKSKSKKYIFLHAHSKVSSSVSYIPADTPDASFAVIHPMEKNVEYSVEHHGDRFFIITNYQATNFRLMETPVNAVSRENWKEVIAHSETDRLDDIDVFENHLVVYGRRDGQQSIIVMNLKDMSRHYISFDEAVYAYQTEANREFYKNELRFSFMSLITPRTVYDYNMDTRERTLLKQYEIPGEYNPSDYQSERIFATAHDGVKIPVSIVYKKGMIKDGSNPFFLYGYGSYEVCIDPEFTVMRASLLDRGFIYGIAHIRGGGEMGRAWYENGKFLKKKNTFKDFISAAEHVITENYTTKDKLVIYGGSAGGLLMGAVTNMRPDLFRAVIAKVPFVDVINTLEDPSLPLTVLEYDEWGNPSEKDYFDYILSYSPYDNVERKNYPNMLITGGLNDPRVQYWEPLKWCAKLREYNTSKNTIMLRINMGAGHSGASGRYESMKEYALDYAFIFGLLGIAE